MISVRPKQEGARVQKVEEICFHSWSTSLSEFHLNSRIVSKYLTCFCAYFVKKNYRSWDINDLNSQYFYVDIEQT